MDRQTKIRQLVWRSKRGLLELELLLAPFVESVLAELSPEELRQYAQLLEHDDLDVYEWLRGKEEAADATLQPIIERIRAAHRR